MSRERKSKPRNLKLAAFSRAMEERMEQIGMSQRSLAKASGIDIRRISDYARGQYSPNYSNMRKLCLTLKLSSDKLMDRAEDLLQEMSESQGRSERPTAGAARPR